MSYVFYVLLSVMHLIEGFPKPITHRGASERDSIEKVSLSIYKLIGQGNFTSSGRENYRISGLNNFR
jgi:hypothetical protein